MFEIPYLMFYGSLGLYINKQCCNVLVIGKVWNMFVIVMPHKTGLVREMEVGLAFPRVRRSLGLGVP